MAKKKDTGKLGSGLENIFGDQLSSVIEDIQNNQNLDELGRRMLLNVNDIQTNPYQPRHNFDETKLQELADSIKEHGVFTPILVRKGETGYQLIAGERRLKASQIAGLNEIPAILMEFTDQQMMEISLLENIQRENLSAIEEAQAFQQLINNLNYTQEQLARRISKSREYVANILRLLKLPQSVQQQVADGKLTMGQVRPLITLENEDDVRTLAKKIEKDKLSAREVERLVSTYQRTAKPKPERKILDGATRDVQNKLQKKFSTRVKITGNSINISYTDTDDFNRIIDLLGCSDEEL